MRLITPIVIALMCISCGSTQGTSALGRVVELPEADLCPGVLRDAIEEARSASSDDDVLVLSQAMRWALDHHELRCTPTETAMDLWRESLAALTRIHTVSSALATAVSLEQTHLPGSLNDRHNSTFREQTEAALSALESTGPHGSEVMEGLLRWYGAGSADCSIELYRSRVVDMMLAADRAPIWALAERFPPLPGGDRCAPVWLVVDFYRELPEADRAELINHIVQAPSASLVRGIETTAAMGEPLAPLTRAIAERACEVVVERTRAEVGDVDAALRDLQNAIRLCVTAENMEAYADLRSQMLTDLVDHDRAQEAWRLVEALPPSELAPPERASIGGAAVIERVRQGEISEATAIMETIAEQIGLDHEELGPARAALRDAIVESVNSAVESHNYEVAQRLLDTAERLCGSAAELRPHRIRVELADLGDVAGGECLPSAERTRRGQELRALRTEIGRSYREDEALVAAYQQTERAWRRYREHCEH